MRKAEQPCQVCASGHNALTEHLNAEVSKNSNEPFPHLDYSGGDVIYGQGQAGRYIYVVCEGLVKLEQKMPGGVARTVRIFSAGGILGLELLATDTYRHSAIGVGRARVCGLPMDAVAYLAQRSTEFQHALMCQWQEALEGADFVIAQLSTGPARRRVARLLLRLCNPNEEGDASSVCQAPPRDDIASLLGLTSETVSRTTANFKRKGVISEKNGVFNCDISYLTLIAQGTEPATPSRALS